MVDCAFEDWKDGRCWVVPLNPDMASFDAAQIRDVTPAPTYTHTALHLQGDGHHHDDDGSYQLDDSQEAVHHVVSDHVCCAAAALLPSAVHTFPPPEASAPSGVHLAPVPDPDLEGLLRPPRVLA